MGKFIDLTGERFGRLVVLKYYRSEKYNRIWECVCDCGNVCHATTHHLRRGCTRSCGCLMMETSVSANITHGMAKSRTYNTWANMLQRCVNPLSTSYINYGKLGISVCQRWYSFDEFLADMGERPAGTSLDRIDSQGNYEPSNCRWATRKEQANNKRSNRCIEYAGIVKNVSQWADFAKIEYSTLYSRIKKGWDIERALNTSVTAQKRRETKQSAP